jgi:hypothetical protein
MEHPTYYDVFTEISNLVQSVIPNGVYNLDFIDEKNVNISSNYLYSLRYPESYPFTKIIEITNKLINYYGDKCITIKHYYTDNKMTIYIKYKMIRSARISQIFE